MQRVVLTPIIIRKELFKLFYLSDLYNLNEKADSSEAFTTVLSLIHSSMCPEHFGEINLDEKCE